MQNNTKVLAWRENLMARATRHMCLVIIGAMAARAAALFAPDTHAAMLPGAIGNDGLDGFDGSITAKARHEFDVRITENAINGNGLSTNGLHDTVNTGRWLGMPEEMNWIIVDLGALYTLDHVTFYNLNNGIAGQTGSHRGIAATTIWIHAGPTEPNASNPDLGGAPFVSTGWTPFEVDRPFVEGPATDPFGPTETVNMGGADARFVALEIKDNHSITGADGFVGISEMQFFGQAAPPPVTFLDRTAQYYSPGLGTIELRANAAWGDYNNDGWVDLCAGGTVLRSIDGLSFTNVVVDTGGPGLWGDYNNDGHLDYFGYYPNKRLLLNNGDGSFTTVTGSIVPPFGANPAHASSGAAWADLDNDGYLDLYVGGFEIWPSTTYPDKILTYDDASQQMNVTWQETVYRARGITACDFDEDGDMDVYVSNYRQQPNRLWRNDGTGSFTDVAAAYGVAGDSPPVAPSLNTYGHTIGSCWGDLDNDGHFDLFVGNFNHHDSRWSDESKFLRNLGPGSGYTFQLMDELDGADWQESYGSPALGDYDNDGDLDLFFATVYVGDHPRLYRNDGNWNFTDVTAVVGLGGLGRTDQAAWADVDNDGDLDLATDGKLFVNDAHANGNHWLKIALEGNGTTVNRGAIGTQVRVSAGGEIMTRQVEGGTGEGNQNDLTLHFGLGSYAGAVDVDILWPDGTTQSFTGVGTDQALTIDPSTGVSVETLPFLTGFETSDTPSYSAGSLAGQGTGGTWSVPAGTVEVKGDVVARGSQAVELQGESSANVAVFASNTVVWTDLYLRTDGSTIPPEVPAGPATSFLFFSAASGLLALNGDGVGGGSFVTVVDSFPCNQFVRVSLRQDYGAHAYDVWVNGAEEATNLGFLDNTVTSMSGVKVESEGQSYLDDLSVTTEGLDADPDMDHLADLDELKFYGTFPNDPDSDGDLMIDGEEVFVGTSATDSNDVYRIDIAAGANQVDVSFDTIPGRLYDVQALADLPAGGWSNVYENIAGDGTEMQRTIENSGPAENVRVVVRP